MAWIPFSDRPEWSDVTPIPAEKATDAVASIAYTPRFRETMAYFRAVLAADEHSLRALDLTKEVIDQNSANYTVWYFRRLILRDPAVETDWKRELEFCNQLSADNPKNYQLWHHRRLCVEEIGDTQTAVDDLAFVAMQLLDDEKNYHAWKHRQCIVERFNLFEAEWALVELMLERDVRNNSAWNQRMFILNRRHPKLLDHEISYCIEAIFRAPDNESPWLYLRGIFVDEDSAKLSDFPQISDMCHAVLEKHAEEPLLLVQALLCLADIAMEKGEKDAASGFLQRLEEVDPIRKAYWQYVAQKL